MTTSPSTILRCRLQPQRLSNLHPPTQYSGFTPISAGQSIQAESLSVPTKWSIALGLGNDLIQALAKDLDLLLPQQPGLATDLSNAIRALEAGWIKHFGDNSIYEYEEQETAANDASGLLLAFAVDAFHAISAITSESDTAGPSPLLKFRRKLRARDASLFIIDNTLCVNEGTKYITGFEDKRAHLLPSAVLELSTRGLSCGIVEVDRRVPKDQPNWWIIANKGPLYAAAYGIDWVVFSGITVYCVGYRVHGHMFWCPVYNRRDEGDELSPNIPGDLAGMFGTDAPSSDPQTGLPLLVLAILLRGIVAKQPYPWLPPMFPNLFGHVFEIPLGTPNTGQFTSYGGDHGDSSDESGAGSGSEGNDGDESGDFDGGGRPASGDKSTRMTRLGSTPLVTGRQRFTGSWLGELAHLSGHSVYIRCRLSEGCHGIVYAADLVRDGQVISAVAVKFSDDKHTLLAEFSRYKELHERMGPYIPRCYGICVTSRTAFLITSLVREQAHKQQLTKADRGAAYAALKMLHKGGWVHNDVVDPVKKVLRNLLWTDTGRPVLIDLVTVSRHRCDGSCTELRVAKKVLGLSSHEIAIWAR
ncbi:hypothetical protein B0H14DRAFT_2935060 [Mycena olivaceomarginata]|nr:hypothetical protein B0H14DRAFT_2935060 [Mycena olivaceomarginata]